jgi:hypothetical protein
MEFIQVAPDPDNTVASLVLLAVAIAFAVGVVLQFRRSKPSRSTRSYRGHSRWRKPYPSPTKTAANNWGLADPKNQLDAIAKVNFERQKLLNASEYRVLTALEETVRELGLGHRVMAQTSVGELLRPKPGSGDWKKRKDAYASINSKRFDFAVVDRWGMLSLAVEYQGEGHHHEKAFMRDAVKREVCRRAGVPFLEVETGMKPAEFRERVMAVLKPAAKSDIPRAS